jgi:hypothetical protein
MTTDPERHDGPTEVVEGRDGELIERLSGGTATLLLVWLIGVGALSTLLGTWVFVWLATGERLGLGALFGGFGLYTSLAGAAGPCVLWLAGRAQGHTLGWFLRTSAKIALVMIGVILGLIVLAALILGGRLPSPAALGLAGIMVLGALGLSVLWALATWAADRWIARARLEEPAERAG